MRASFIFAALEIGKLVVISVTKTALSKEIMKSFDKDIFSDSKNIKRIFNKELNQYLIKKINFLNINYLNLKKANFKSGLYRFSWYLKN